MRQRLIRVLVYEGDPAWIEAAIAHRAVKGSFCLGSSKTGNIIKEAIVGDFLDEVIERIVEESPDA